MKIGKTLMTLALVGVTSVTGCEGEGDTDQPSPDAAAQQAPAPGQDMDPETMELMMEAQELDQQLAPIQQEAMQDEDLAAQLQALQELIQTAMREEDPELMGRMEQLEEEFMAAQEAGDQERVQEIGMAAQQIQMEFQALQQRVLDRPDIQEPIDAFEAAQRERMIEIDPEAGDIIDRIDEILAQLDLQ